MTLRKRGRRKTVAALGVAGAASVAAAVGLIGISPAHAEADVLGAESADAVEGSFVVKLKDDVEASSQSVDSLAGDYEANVDETFDVFNGFSAEMSDEDARRLAADSAVDYVEQDVEVSINAVQENPKSWGLDRVDQEAAEGDKAYNYPDSAGEGVTAYVIDTGVDIEHPDLEGRAEHGTNTHDGNDDASDGNGHGTHVAGTVAGTEYGLAKAAKVVGVKTLGDDGTGSLANVVAGVEWVAENAEGPSVANLSLGGGADQAMDDAITALVESGVTAVVAAGNANEDACDSSPARAEAAITVGATDVEDVRPTDWPNGQGSNYGKCLDIFAPGDEIVSSVPGGGEDTFSGTSMASPHVAGAAALFLADNADAKPADVEAALIDNALTDVVQEPGEGSPNLLLNTGFLLEG